MIDKTIFDIYRALTDVVETLPKNLYIKIQPNMDKIGELFPATREQELSENSAEFKAARVNSVEFKERILEHLYSVYSTVYSSREADDQQLQSLNWIKMAIVKSINFPSKASGEHQLKWRDILESSLNSNAGIDQTKWRNLL